MNRVQFLEALYAQDQNLRNDDAAVEKIMAAFDSGQERPPDPTPVNVQRVDEYVRPGEVRTTWEVVDRRLPRDRRIVMAGFTTEQAARTEQQKRMLLPPLEGPR